MSSHKPSTYDRASESFSISRYSWSNEPEAFQHLSDPRLCVVFDDLLASSATTKTFARLRIIRATDTLVCNMLHFQRSPSYFSYTLHDRLAQCSPHRPIQETVALQKLSESCTRLRQQASALQQRLILQRLPIYIMTKQSALAVRWIQRDGVVDDLPVPLTADYLS